MRVLVFGAFSVLIACSAGAASYNHKKQDADYVREVCKLQGGQTEKAVSKRSRVDCLTKNFAIEVDYADLWKKNVDQALRYGKDSGRKAKLILVVENKSELNYVRAAKAEVKRRKLDLIIETHENFTSKEISLASIPGPPVKKSKSGNKCHVKGRGSYGQTKSFLAYQTMEACVASGGVRAKNTGI